MRKVIWFHLSLCIILLVAGGYLLLNADLLVDNAQVRWIGEKLRWPGMWAMTTKGCSFSPDRERWEAGFQMAGAGLMLLGGGCCVWCARRLNRYSAAMSTMRALKSGDTTNARSPAKGRT